VFFVYTMKVSGVQYCFGSDFHYMDKNILNILRNIIFCVLLKKESISGLECDEGGVNDDRIKIFQ